MARIDPSQLGQSFAAGKRNALVAKSITLEQIEPQRARLPLDRAAAVHQAVSDMRQAAAVALQAATRASAVFSQGWGPDESSRLAPAISHSWHDFQTHDK